MQNNSKPYILFPKFLENHPEFVLSDSLAELVKVSYYQSMDDIQKICTKTIELIILEDKMSTLQYFCFEFRSGYQHYPIFVAQVNTF